MDELNSGVGERSPFLESAERNDSSKEPSRCSRRNFWVILYAVALLVTMDLPITIAGAPQTRLYEAIYCLDWYRRNDPSSIGNNGMVDEQFCKIDPVQADVSLLKGWMGFFDNLPGWFSLAKFGESASRHAPMPYYSH